MGDLAAVQQSLTDAADGFKQMMITLLVFSLLVTIAIVMISISLKK